MLTTFGFIAPTTAVIVLVIALVIFGPGKLPDIGKALGNGIKEFKTAANDDVGRASKDEQTNIPKANDSKTAEIKENV